MSEVEVKKELPAELTQSFEKPHAYDGGAYDFFQVKPGEDGKGFLVECPQGCGYTVTKEGGAFTLNPTTDVQPIVYAAKPSELIDKYGEASTQMGHHEFYRAPEGAQVINTYRHPDKEMGVQTTAAGATANPYSRTIMGEGISLLPSEQATDVLSKLDKAAPTVPTTPTGP